MTYAEALARKLELESLESAASARLRAIPGVGTGPMGLTPDHVKASPEYRAARMARESAWSQLTRFNAWFTRVYAREYRADRHARLYSPRG